MAKYKIIKCKDSIESAIDSGISELESLQEEMESWASGMEDTNLQNSEKCATVRESADTLESAANDARQALEELRNEIQELFEGKPGKPACEPHELGKNCKRCNWTGNPPHRFRPTLTIHDPPEKEQIERFNWGKKETQKHTRLVYATVQVSENQYDLYTSERYDNPAGAIELAKEKFKHELVFYEQAQAIPKERPEIPPVEPVFPESYVSPLELEVSWIESRPYGKHVSRATRLGCAMEGIRAGIEGLRDWLEGFNKEDQESPEWFDSISSHVDELEQTLEECETVEFPGMYG